MMAPVCAWRLRQAECGERRQRGGWTGKSLTGNASSALKPHTTASLTLTHIKHQTSNTQQDKATGLGAGYGFVRYADRRCAGVALQHLSGKLLLGREMRVSWALQPRPREDTSAHHHVFVGDLGQDVTDAALFAAFAAHVPGCS